ncbi:MAG: hypothetical protein ACRD3J_03950, partial [Thermoanaerobaculia bacterium]
MREDDRIDLADWDWQRLVLFVRFFSPTLKHAAIEQHGTSIHVQNVAGAGYFPRSSYKGYLQPLLSLGHSAALKKDCQTMFVLRHERRLPPSPASLVQKVGQCVFVVTRVARELDYYGLIFFHMGVYRHAGTLHDAAASL